MNKFKTLQIENVPTFHSAIVEQEKPLLEDGEVFIKSRILRCQLHKDALASSEAGGVIRSYPMTPGIDLAGIVVESQDERYQSGDPVLVTGYGLGVSHPGGGTVNIRRYQETGSFHCQLI